MDASLAPDADAALPTQRDLILYAGSGGANSHIWQVRADGSDAIDLEALAPLGVHADSPKWSKDGTKILFSYKIQGPAMIAIMNADGSGVVDVITDGTYPDWVPDGRIVFGRAGQIYVANGDGTDERFLTAGGGPTVSPDGTTIAFARAPSQAEGSHIYTILLDGSAPPTRLMAVGMYDYSPRWSPDGSRIAFVRTGVPNFNSVIAVVNSDGTGDTVLTGPEAARGPAWSPDGTQIAYQIGTGVNAGVYKINADGTAKTLIKAAVGAGAGLSWL